MRHGEALRLLRRWRGLPQSLGLLRKDSLSQVRFSARLRGARAQAGKHFGRGLSRSVPAADFLRAPSQFRLPRGFRVGVLSFIQRVDQVGGEFGAILGRELLQLGIECFGGSGPGGLLPLSGNGSFTRGPDGSGLRCHGSDTGVRVESQRGAETGWAYLGVDLQSPYTDTRPPLAEGQPEVRKYRLRYLQGDQLTGDYSAVQSVTTVP